jgi:hypothetical protein
MSKKRDSLENYVLLLSAYEKMRFTKFKAKAFIKFIRPYCKTENVKDKHLFIRIRNSNTGIHIQVKKDCFIVQKSYQLHEFIFYCDTANSSAKTLLNKLFKHNLLTY